MIDMKDKLYFVANRKGEHVTHLVAGPYIEMSDAEEEKDKRPIPYGANELVIVSTELTFTVEE